MSYLWHLVIVGDRKTILVYSSGGLCGIGEVTAFSSSAAADDQKCVM